MHTTLSISPMTRIEGHLDIEVVMETVGGKQQVIHAHSAAVNFRGFEIILQGRDPRDATHYTQRICGVCPIAHAMASTKALEAAFGVTPTDNGRILRNLVLGANFIQSHVLHQYHLAAPDYINTEALLDLSPWKPRFSSPDMLSGDTAAALVQHYVTALNMRRKAHRMGAIFGGRMPCAVNFVPGGSSSIVTAEGAADFRALLNELRTFIDNVMIPDVQALANAFAEYAGIGIGCGNLLAYGVFDLDASGSTKLLARGRYTDGTVQELDESRIREYVTHSWYTPNSGERHPSDGVTEPDAYKDAGYSWIKAPRYEGIVHEVGPLARMWVNGDYRQGISVIDRLAARALETKKVADAMVDWLDQLRPGDPVYSHRNTPTTGTGVGLTEAPRGALGHWLAVASQRISRYQVVSPTGWNCSPRDDQNRPGALEQALVGTPVRDPANPIEVLRVVHSFDPCLACSVHMVRPDRRRVVTVVEA